MDKQVNGPVEIIMSPPASLTWQRHKNLLKVKMSLKQLDLKCVLQM